VPFVAKVFERSRRRSERCARVRSPEPAK
jgi:hypothetical protein